MRAPAAILAMLMMGLAAMAPATAADGADASLKAQVQKHRLTVTEMPTPQKDKEAQIFRRDHREKD